MTPGWTRCLGQALIVAAATCYTVKDVRDAVCQALCKRDGYASGRSAGKNFDRCECFDIKNPKELQSSSVSLGYHQWETSESESTKREYPYTFRTDD